MPEALLARSFAHWGHGVLMWSLGRVLIAIAECTVGHSAECTFGITTGGIRTEESRTEANFVLCYAM